MFKLLTNRIFSPNINISAKFNSYHPVKNINKVENPKSIQITSGHGFTSGLWIVCPD